MYHRGYSKRANAKVSRKLGGNKVRTNKHQVVRDPPKTSERKPTKNIDQKYGGSFGGTGFTEDDFDV